MNSLGRSTPKINPPPPKPSSPGASIPYPTWHAVSSELLTRHREFGLSYGEVCLYSILVHYSSPDENGVPVSHARNKVLAREMGCADSEIRRFLKGLEDAGLVIRLKREGREKSRAGISLVWAPGEPAVVPYPSSDLHLRREALVGADPVAPTPESARECTPESAYAPTPESARTHAGKRACNEIPPRGGEESKRIRTPAPPSPSPTRPGSEPSPSSPGEEDGTGLPPGFNVTGLGGDSIRRALQSGVDQARRRASADQGGNAEGGWVFDRSRIPRALGDARAASRGPTRKITADELRAQVEALKARSAKENTRPSAS